MRNLACRIIASPIGLYLLFVQVIADGRASPAEKQRPVEARHNLTRQLLLYQPISSSLNADPRSPRPGFGHATAMQNIVPHNEASFSPAGSPAVILRSLLQPKNVRHQYPRSVDQADNVIVRHAGASRSVSSQASHGGTSLISATRACSRNVAGRYADHRCR